MSTARRLRRSVIAHHQAEKIRTAHEAPVTSVRALDAEHDAISKGPALFIVPKIHDAMPPELKNAIARRRQATLTGRCECGAVRRTLPTRHGVVRHDVFRHEHDCTASDDGIAELARCLGWRWPS